MGSALERALTGIVVCIIFEGTVFFVKGMIDLCKVLVRIMGGVYQGQVVEVKEVKEERTFGEKKTKYLYLIDVEMNGEKKQIEFAEELTEGAAPSIKVGAKMGIYINKRTRTFESMREYWKKLWLDLSMVALSVAISVIVFLVLVSV